MLLFEEIIKQKLEKDWCKEEFKMVDFNDKRIDKRFLKVSEQLSDNPAASINQACGPWADTKGAYRLFANEKVTSDVILKAHQEPTIERIKSETLVLVLHDTSYIDFTNHKSKKGIGLIGSSILKGLLMHNSLVTTSSGLPLGLIEQNIWAREKEKGHSKKRKRIPIEEKESTKWLINLENSEKLRPSGTRFIHICDREADIYELFLKVKELKSEILIRAAQNRKLSNEADFLWSYIEKEEVEFKLEIEVPPNKKQKKRKAILEIRYKTITLSPPVNLPKKEKERMENIEIDALLAGEIDAPKDVEPLEWMLLTNVSVRNNKDALERLNWYKSRWNIEVYHKVIKSGCAIENCRLKDAERLIPYITLCSIIAWRLFWMTMINRETPDGPCTLVLEEHEWKALYTKIHSTKRLPEKLPTVREVIRWMAQLGGFLGRKGDKEPGITVIWRGWQRLQDIADMWLIMQSY